MFLSTGLTCFRYPKPK